MEERIQLQEIRQFKKKLEERFPNKKIEIWKKTREYTKEEIDEYTEAYISAIGIVSYVCVIADYTETRGKEVFITMFSPYFRSYSEDIEERYYRHHINNNDFVKFNDQPQLLFDF